MQDDDQIPADWLFEKLDLEAVEQEYTPRWQDDPERAARHPELKLPFGFNNSAWVQFRDKVQPGDEIWRFSSPIESWEHLAGRGGIALVRAGKVIATITTMMS